MENAPENYVKIVGDHPAYNELSKFIKFPGCTYCRVTFYNNKMNALLK